MQLNQLLVFTKKNCLTRQVHDNVLYTSLSSWRNVDVKKI